MEAHNLHPQAVAASLGYAAWEAAAREVPVEGAGALHLADLACLRGANSVQPFRRALGILRQRAPGRALEVTHTDLPHNDFNQVIRLVSGPQGYLGDSSDVFASVRAGSFYQALFPTGSLTLAWCATATHWLSRLPCRLGGLVSSRAHAAARQAWKEQARLDWQAWVDCRADELVQGGQLVMVGSGADRHGYTGAEGLLSVVGESLVEAGLQAELPAYHRTRQEWLAPLGPRLAVREVLEPIMPDPFWNRYQATGDREAYADQVLGFVRASFDQPLVEGQPGDFFYQRVRERVLANPDRARCRWWVMVLRLEKI